MTDNLKSHATTVRAQFRAGQNIWRRPSVGGLLKRIDELEAEQAAAERRGWDAAKEQALQYISMEQERRLIAAMQYKAAE